MLSYGLIGFTGKVGASVWFPISAAVVVSIPCQPYA